MGLTPTAKVFGRVAILASLITIITVISVLTEIFIDSLTVQTRELRHLFKHSFGNVGTLMIFLSLAGYMIKKRWRPFPGKLKDYLYLHQSFAAIAGVLIAVHSGAHFKAGVPVLTSVFMVICVVSGFMGRFVYLKAKKDIAARKVELADAGIESEEVEEKLAIATAAASSLSNWRKFHQPASAVLVLLIIVHVVSALFFGG